MYETLRELYTAGHQLDVLTLNTKKHYQDPSVLAPFCWNVRSVDVDTEVTLLRIIKGLVHPRFPHEFNIPSRVSYWVARFAHPDVLDALQEMTKTEVYDVIVCETLFTACYGIAARRWNMEHALLPIVVRSHNVEYRIQERLSHDDHRPWYERLYRRTLAAHTKVYETYVGQTVEAIATMSHADRQVFQSANATALIEAIPPGIAQPPDSHQLVDKDAVCILGSMDWAPNVEGVHWFIRSVYPILRSLRPQTTIHIAGRSMPASIKALADNLGIFVYSEVDDAVEFRRRFAVTAVPLRSGSGIRIKILEALASSCAVVTTSVGCEGINVENRWHVLIADEALSFAQACCLVLDNAELRSSLATHGLAFVMAQYSWPSSIEKLVAFFKRVVLDTNRETVSE